MDIGRETEDGGGQQVNLVIHDQAPVVLIKKIKVCVYTLLASRQHLIRSNRDRLDFLFRAGVLADLIFGQGGALKEFASPLMRRHGVGHQDQGGGFGHGHGSSTNDGLAGTAGKHDYSASTASKILCGFALVGAQFPIILHQLNGVRLAVNVSGEVFSRPSQFEQDLLDLATLAGVHDDGVFINALAD